MGRILRIKNRGFSDILGEGAQLIQRGILTGFNFDEETPLTQLALIVQYYHNVEEHISKFLEKIQELHEHDFGQPICFEKSIKWGLFRWLEDFDDEPGNKYYAVLPEEFPRLELISFDEVKTRIPNETVLAKDKCYLITFNATDGARARFLIDKIRKYCMKYIRPGEANPERIDEYAHAKPLFILRDDSDQVPDKSDLELVYRLELKKDKRVISSLIRAGNLETVLQKLREFPCGMTVKQERRYVGKEFFQDY